MTTPPSLPGLIISKQFFVPNLTGGLIYPLDSYAAFGYTVVAVNGLKTTSGSVKATFKIGSTAIPGLNEITVNTISNNITLTGGSNVVVPTNNLSLFFDTALSPQNIQFTLVAVRADLLSGFVNKIRNPVMDVAQRSFGTIVSSPSPGTSAPTLDGWIVTAVGTGGATVTWGQAGWVEASDGVYAAHSLGLTGAVGITHLTVSQRIESSIAASLSGKQITFQCVVDNWTGSPITPVLSSQYLTATDSWGTVVTDPNCSSVSLQPCQTGGTTIVSYTFTCNTDAYNGYGFTIDCGAITGSGLYLTQCDVRVTPDTATGLNYNPPIPEIRPVAVEFPSCLRYLAGFGESTGIVGLAYSTSTTAFGVYIPFKNKMRTPPTGITVVTPGNLEIVDMTGASVAAVTSLSFGNASEDGIFLTGTVAGGLGTNQSYQLNVNTVLAGNVVFTGAEL